MPIKAREPVFAFGINPYDETITQVIIATGKFEKMLATLQAFMGAGMWGLMRLPTNDKLFYIEDALSQPTPMAAFQLELVPGLRQSIVGRCFVVGSPASRYVAPKISLATLTALITWGGPGNDMPAHMMKRHRQAVAAHKAESNARVDLHGPGGVDLS